MVIYHGRIYLKKTQIQVNVSQLQRAFHHDFTCFCFLISKAGRFNMTCFYKKPRFCIYFFASSSPWNSSACESTQTVEHFLMGYQPREGLKGKTVLVSIPLKKY